MSEYQEPDAAAEFDGNGEEHLRQGSDEVPIDADCLGHAGRLWVRLLYRLALVDRAEGGFRGRHLGVELGSLDGRSTVLLDLQEGRTGVPLLVLTLPAEVLAAAPGALRSSLLGGRGDGYLSSLDGFLRGLGEREAAAALSNR
jgi:hypothetical protein